MIYPGLDTGLMHVFDDDIIEEAFGINFEECVKQMIEKKKMSLNSALVYVEDFVQYLEKDDNASIHDKTVLKT